MSKKFAVGNCELIDRYSFEKLAPIDIHYYTTPPSNSMGFAFTAKFNDGSIRMYREDGLCPDAPGYTLKFKPVERVWKDKIEVPADARYFKRDDEAVFTLSSFGGRLELGRETNINFGSADLGRWKYGPTLLGPWKPCTVVE